MSTFHKKHTKFQQSQLQFEESLYTTLPRADFICPWEYFFSLVIYLTAEIYLARARYCDSVLQKMLEVGTKALDFKLPDQNGELHKLSEYLGKKVKKKN